VKKYKKIIIFLLLATLMTGCATIPARDTLATYKINGARYFPLITLCESRNIDWQYDTFTKTVYLSKNMHRVNFRVGDNLVLVDGSPLYLNRPIDISRGTIFVPYKFKEKVLDTFFKETYPVRRQAPSALKVRKIVIDAGHGGRDPGAVGKTGLREKDVNLDIAKRLSKLLKSAGFEVAMTRTTDRFVSLSQRGGIANSARADLFISVHANANRVRSLKGFEIYYISPKVSDSKRAYTSARTAKLRLSNVSFGSPSQNLKAILWDMIYTHSRAESIELSRSICQTMKNNLGVRILGIKGANFEVLRRARMPAVLIEVGFLSNSQEERKLKNSYYRGKVAEAIAQGINNYARSFTLMETARR